MSSIGLGEGPEEDEAPAEDAGGTSEIGGASLSNGPVGPDTCSAGSGDPCTLTSAAAAAGAGPDS
ncbi:hypothetical protein Taro_016546 [Colocasia esculenta]|uniref:Uncharacterized protein n=1 Tax=Colocasia esculenta TaxID=4460 RepID=A0A843UKL7_COLES|nr:hypothetical protein [Colocasia esculenta]